MSETAAEPAPPASITLRRFLALFGPGLVGVVALALTIAIDPAGLPPELADLPPLTLAALVAVQPTLLLAVAVLLGLYAAPRVGFRSHLLDRVTHGTPLLEGCGSELKPAIGLGVLAGVLIVVAEPLLAPTPPAAPETEATVRAVLATVPLRFLYGGITEELLLRWGFMSVLAFGLWRTVGRGAGDLSDGLAWAAVVAAAVLFGIGHLPNALVVYGELTTEVVVWIVVGNAIGGIAFGWLYWRHSNEAAMVAHAMAHVVFVSVSLVAIGSSP